MSSAENPRPMPTAQNAQTMDANLSETQALLQLLALGKKEYEAGKFSDLETFLKEMDD